MSAYPITQLSVALVRHPREPESKWLAQWDSQTNCYQLVSAVKPPELSYRECLNQVLPLRLGLNPQRDYLMSGMSRMHLDTALQLPERQTPTLYSVEFFVVDLYGSAALAKVDANPHHVWLHSTEWLAGQSAEGLSISPVLVQLLRVADLFSAEFLPQNSEPHQE